MANALARVGHESSSRCRLGGRSPRSGPGRCAPVAGRREHAPRPGGRARRHAHPVESDVLVFGPPSRRRPPSTSCRYPRPMPSDAGEPSNAAPIEALRHVLLQVNVKYKTRAGAVHRACRPEAGAACRLRQGRPAGLRVGAACRPARSVVVAPGSSERRRAASSVGVVVVVALGSSGRRWATSSAGAGGCRVGRSTGRIVCATRACTTPPERRSSPSSRSTVSSPCTRAASRRTTPRTSGTRRRT